MKIPERYKPEFRPATYWNDGATILANVKGEWRRRQIRAAVGSRELDAMPPVLFRDSLPDDLLARVGSLHPAFMGGEYLPDYLPGEVEIARVALASTTGDVISVRARRASRRIRYRVVDEYADEGSEYRLPRSSSVRPLSFAELVDLLDGTPSEYFDATQLVRHHWDELRREGLSLEEASDFTTVSSTFYPQLEPYYCDEATRWVESIRRERLLEDPREDLHGYAGLHWAVWQGDPDLARELLEAGAEVDARTPAPRDGYGGLTPLHNAAFCGEIELARLLLDHGADVDAIDESGATPIVRTWRNAAAMTSLLLRHGATASFANDSGNSALHRAATLGQVEAARILIAAGAPVAARGGEGVTPLHMAASRAIVRSLVEAGANVNARDDDGRTPLHYAAGPGLEHAVFPGACKHPPAPDAACATMVRVGPPAIAAARALLAAGAEVGAGDDKGRTPLHFARSTWVARLLLDAGADPDADDADGNRPLHFASARGATALVGRLLESGADASAGNARGDVPLHLAAERGHGRIVRRLLEAGGSGRMSAAIRREASRRASENGHTRIARVIIMSVGRGERR